MYDRIQYEIDQVEKKRLFLERNAYLTKRINPPTPEECQGMKIEDYFKLLSLWVEKSLAREINEMRQELGLPEK